MPENRWEAFSELELRALELAIDELWYCPSKETAEAMLNEIEAELRRRA